MPRPYKPTSPPPRQRSPGRVERLPLDMLKIVHFKQARHGAALPSVDTGDLDCLKMQEILDQKGYEGAAVMEIPPDQHVFDNLASSYAYLGSV